LFRLFDLAEFVQQVNFFQPKYQTNQIHQITVIFWLLDFLLRMGAPLACRRIAAAGKTAEADQAWEENLGETEFLPQGAG
jgi:hypothetical protein